MDRQEKSRRQDLTGSNLGVNKAYGGLSFSVLGTPGRDNSVLVYQNTGNRIYRFLFDCGAECLNSLSVSEVQQVNKVFFSHLHIDHIAGFDHLLRMNYNRAAPLEIVGPDRTIEIIHHRLQGVLWDRTSELKGEVIVEEVSGDTLRSAKFKVSEGYRICHDLGTRPIQGRTIHHTSDHSVRCVALDHGTPSLGYILQEAPKLRIDSEKLKIMGLSPGPWLKQILDDVANLDSQVSIKGRLHTLAELRRELVICKPPEAIAYLTDFVLNESTRALLVAELAGCGTIICENNYKDEHFEQARVNYHLTTSQVADLFAAIDPKKLVLFHLSDRYNEAEWNDALRQVRSTCRATFPVEWEI